MIRENYKFVKCDNNFGTMRISERLIEQSYLSIVELAKPDRKLLYSEHLKTIF